MQTIEKKKNAYVMLVMKGDKYGFGAVITSFSLKHTGTPWDIVCMVTPDVSEEMQKMISTVARVVKIDYLEFPTRALKTQRQEDIYGSWNSQSYTKAQCLTLWEYNKIIFLDADIIVVQNIDHLFELNAPAATFSSPWGYEYDEHGPFMLTGYPNEHGKPVLYETIMKNMNSGGFTLIGSLMLLEPSKNNYNNYLKKISEEISRQGNFGFDCYSTVDEQSIVFSFTNWTHIHQKYNFILHKIEWLRKNNTVEIPHVLHYFSDKKPWLLQTSWSSSIYNTTKIWWYLFWRFWQMHILQADSEILIKKYGAEFPLLKLLDDAQLSSFRIKLRRIDYDHFPWLLVYNLRFPMLFSN